MARFGFVGPSYSSESLLADSERTLNWYVESIEGAGNKTALALYPTPGLKLFAALGGQKTRGIFAINGRCFAVADTNLYEILATAEKNLLGQVANDGSLVSFASSPQQLLIASGARCYVLTLATNQLQDVSAAMLGAIAKVDYCDGFFLALLQNSAEFQVSSVLDATTWDPTSAAIVSVFPDNVAGMLVSHREVSLLGLKASVVYYDSGNLFPFDVVPGSYVETGIAAPLSLCRLDNSVFWIGGDERGAGIAWRASGYTPQRVSNHAVEQAWRLYPTIADAVAYSYIDKGHTFWVICFPTANATWVYDCATGLWHERGFLNPATGQFQAHKSWCHAYVFGRHLVGDWSSANVYDMSVDHLDDAGSPLGRVRRAPPVGTENEWLFHKQFEALMETGLGPIPPLTDSAGNARAPQVGLRWSNDGGRTWSNQYFTGAGEAGQYQTRVIWRRLGRGRNRIYELSVSDPVPWRVIDGFLLADPDFQPEERLQSRFRKMT